METKDKLENELKKVIEKLRLRMLETQLSRQEKYNWTKQTMVEK